MPTNPQSLALLRRSSLNIPGVDDVQVSPDVMEAAPDLSLDTPKTAYEVAANERLKQMLGLGERSPQFKQQQAGLLERDKAINDARIAQDPEVSAEADKAYQEKLGLAGEGARVAAKGAQDLEKTKHANVMDFLGMNGSGAGNGQPQDPNTAPFKMSIGPNEEPSFTPNTMPALVQRSRQQLQAAHEQHLAALQEAERLWPGVNDAAGKADQGQAPGVMGSLEHWFGNITGVGAPKYGGPSDTAALASEAARYRARQDTPLSKFIQTASFGNIEQMAGQLPGVRGLATVTPLFKEHQTALTSGNPGSPLSNVQRLRHLIKAEEDSLQMSPEEFAAGYAGKD